MMQNALTPPRSLRRAAAGVALTVACGLAAALPSGAGARTATRAAPPRPTIVLVHGAWANSAAWTGVISRLQSRGYTVDAPPNPLRSLPSDAATIHDYVASIKGPVVLVGHSYGGAVITNAARGLPNVTALVYVDAFLPERGESARQLTAKYPGSVLAAPPATVFAPVPQPGAPASDPLLYVQPSAFVTGFANDLPRRQAAVLAATQAPMAAAAGADRSGAPAWRTIRSWDVVGTVDRVIPPRTQRFMAHRAHARIVDVHGGHLSMVSHPGAIARVIGDAATTGG